ncbi:hypothetical protein [Enhygromyxa salina]|uniref:hypothetical protein n=1 Tax=Enhygromyxa salina TaxID=215803 RepID=UPI0015E60DED|nr:hypothetical protein [Enhygromyxa salina]
MEDEAHPALAELAKNAITALNQRASGDPAAMREVAGARQHLVNRDRLGDLARDLLRRLARTVEAQLRLAFIDSLAHRGSLNYTRYEPAVGGKKCGRAGPGTGEVAYRGSCNAPIVCLVNGARHQRLEALARNADDQAVGMVVRLLAHEIRNAINPLGLQLALLRRHIQAPSDELQDVLDGLKETISRVHEVLDGAAQIGHELSARDAADPDDDDPDRGAPR